MAKKANNETVTETSTPNLYADCPLNGYLESDANRMRRVISTIEAQCKAVKRRSKKAVDMTPEQKEQSNAFYRALLQCKVLLTKNDEFDVSNFASDNDKSDDNDSLFT